MKNVCLTGFLLLKKQKRSILCPSLGRFTRCYTCLKKEKQIWEINAANGWFDNKLTPVLVKLKGIYDEVNSISCKSVKKQVFEMERIVKSIIDGMN